MDLLKNNLIADAAGWLYRSAFHMASGKEKLAKEMFDMAAVKLGLDTLSDLNTALTNFSTDDMHEKKILAEKILDKYQSLMFEIQTKK